MARARVPTGFDRHQRTSGLYSARGNELVLQAQGDGERGLAYVLTYTRMAD